MISKTLIVLIVLVSLYALCLANYNTIPQQQPYHSSHQQQQPNDMIHISQIQAFTVYKNQYTTSRRGQPVLQMKCVGGDAQLTGYHPDVIQCKNVGFDGISVQWECQASMDDKYKLGKVHVNCEGYAGPGDANVLKGSCAVDYELMYTEKGRRINQQQPPSYTYNTQNQRSNTYPRTANPVYEDDSGSGSGVIIFLVIVAVLVFVLVALGSSKVPNSSATTSPTYVPPYNPNIYPDVRSTTTPSAPSINPTTAFVGGFATGAATGYMAGRASNNSTHRRNSYDRDTYYGTSTYSNTTNTSYSTSNNSRNSDEKSGEHVSKSFGGSSSR